MWFETPKHLVTLKKEDKTTTYQALIDAGKQKNWQTINPSNDDFIIFDV